MTSTPQRHVVLAIAVAILAASCAATAHAQTAVYAGLAYSQSTGKIGYTAGRARSEKQAQEFAVASCGAPDAKAYIWGPNEYVAIAVVEGQRGTAGFGRDRDADQAQRKALAECQKRGKGAACRVMFCIHANGAKPQQLLMVARDPNAPAPTPAATVAPPSGFFAAIAYSPSTGKVGSSAGEGRTKEEAQALAIKKVAVKDAKVFMWGNQWVAMAMTQETPGKAAFAPGATRAVAEAAALEQCRKLAHGAPARIVVAIHSSGKDEKALAAAKPEAQARVPGTPAAQPTTAAKPVTPAPPVGAAAVGSPTAPALAPPAN